MNFIILIHPMHSACTARCKSSPANHWTNTGLSIVANGHTKQHAIKELDFLQVSFSKL